MARVTIEDCLQSVENRFKLVLLASERARQLQHGATEFLPRLKDKDTVLALREIAAGHVTPENIALLHRIPEPQHRNDQDHSIFN
jgi:DNA-directed RNA polymerase subunit omega